ncbi:hypothetical protein HY632_01295 [Candidatus Uhrbacteria bacterium]|nr:hypothetical protein [Candidatus Uhrbacteria bacterium]
MFWWTARKEIIAMAHRPVTFLLADMERRLALPSEHEEHLPAGQVAALLDGELVPRHLLETKFGIPVRTEALVDRLIERDYHLAISKSHAPDRGETHLPAGKFRASIPLYVRMPHECMGRLERPLIVGAAVWLEQLIEEAENIQSHVVLEGCVDVVEAPRDRFGHRMERYVAFTQLGALYPGMSAVEANPFFVPEHEVGLTLREGLHAVLQHPLPIRESGIVCAGTRCYTAKNEERVPVIVFDQAHREYLIRSDKLDSAYRGVGVATRFAQVVCM